MTDRLDGRVALVTGASRGLGRAIAHALAAEGAAVAVAARTEKVWSDKLPGTIGETVEEIRAAGGKAVAIRADLLEAGEPARLVDEVHTSLGPLSILVNNAAFTAPGRPPKAGEPTRTAPPSTASPSTGRADWPTFLGTPLHAFRRHFDICVFAAYELMQLAAADMIDAGGGAIINVTSSASRMPGDGPYLDRSEGMLPGYGGSKAALEHLTQCAAFDLQPAGVSVNALSPSVAILTPGVAFYSRDFAEYGSEEDFAEAAVRLCVVDPGEVTGRTIGHLDVLSGSYEPWPR